MVGEHIRYITQGKVLWTGTILHCRRIGSEFFYLCWHTGRPISEASWEMGLFLEGI
jgi:hypothetical protein